MIETVLAQAAQAHQQGRPVEAANAFREVLKTAPDNPEALHGLGVIYDKSGQHETALGFLARAAQLRPQQADIQSHLGAAQRSLEDLPAAIGSFRKALELAPSDPLMKVNLALALQDDAQLDEALNLFREAIADDSACAEAHMGLGRALIPSAPQEAERALRQALALRPTLHAAHVQLGIVLVSSGRPQLALEHVALFLRQFPNDMEGLAQRAIALRELGHTVEARLLDDPSFVRAYPLAPSGFGSTAEFNRALERHIRQHPYLTSHVRTHATVNGRRVDRLLTPPKGPIAVLQQEIYGPVTEFWQSLPKTSSDPCISPYSPPRAPEKMQMYMWAVLLASQGYEAPHLHPSGRISGVYYVKLPKAVQQSDDASKAGWIEFGVPDPAYAPRAMPPVHSLKPVEGTLLLFPSYFWHHTVPFEDDEERISISFDVMVPDQ